MRPGNHQQGGWSVKLLVFRLSLGRTLSFSRVGEPAWVKSPVRKPGPGGLEGGG